MNPKTARAVPGEPDPHAACLVETVAAALAGEPGVEAVTIDGSGQKISVATLGTAVAVSASERIAATVRDARSAEAACGLLSGHGDCGTCDLPHDPGIHRGFTVAQRDGRTTIAG